MTMKSINRRELLHLIEIELGTHYRASAINSTIQERKQWSALDILEIKIISNKDKLWCVLREELIDPKTLHEFACVCAERALSRVENPDPRSVAAIAAKRAWMRGEITDKELDVARDAAWAAARDAAWDATWASASDAAWASASDAAWAAASDAARDAAWDAPWAAARVSAWAAERAWQVEELKKMLREEEV